jgi:hypothetical protein
MDITARTALTSALTTHVASIAAVLRRQILDEAGPRAAAEQLHADENVGEDFEVWTDLLSRRAAVLWVLKSVYVRVLEDRGLLSPKRIVGGSSSQLFASSGARPGGHGLLALGLPRPGARARRPARALCSPAG